MPPPVGPEVDTTPRPLPARVTILGQHVVLEPLHIRHAPELWHAAQGADESWTYLGMGPFASAEAMRRPRTASASGSARASAIASEIAVSFRCPSVALSISPRWRSIQSQRISTAQA